MMTRVTTLVMMASSSANALLMIRPFGPAHGEPEQQRCDQRAHDGHERRDVQHKGRLRRSTSPLTSVGTDRCGMMA